jgi:plastocyanin
MSGTAISLGLYLILLVACSPQREKVPARDGEYGEYEIADSPPSPEKFKTHTIQITQMKFEPSVVDVHKGDKIVWVNSDFVEHDITEAITMAWASEKLPAGASWSMTVTKSELYYCNLHVVMKGKIVVDGADIAMLEESSGITMCK